MVLWKKESTHTDALYIDLMDKELKEYLEYQITKLTLNTNQKDDERSTELRLHANQQFKAQNWRAAMELYNQTLRYAPEGSKNISLAYANRSACFLHMKMYDECLTDIELARATNCPQRLMHKLDERQVTCIEMMKKPRQRNKVKEAALSYAPNEQFPSLANVLDIRSNDEFGKHIVATQDIEVGQIVVLEDAFVHEANDHNQTLCKTCAQPAKNFIPCHRCTDHMFCDNECMESNTVHKLMCGVSLKSMNGLWILVVKSILLAATAIPNANRLMEFVKSALSTRDLDAPKCDTEAQAKYRMFLKLFVVPGELNDDSKLLITFAYQKMLEIREINHQFQSAQSQRFLMHLIWQHFRILQTNSISFENREEGSDDLQHVLMFANYFSLFNHSCYSNATSLRQGNQMMVCTVRPIKSGEQLFINYDETPDVVTFEQTGLREKLQFECKCSKCIPCWNPEDRLKIQMDSDFLFIKQIHQNYCKNPEKLALLKGKVLKLLEKYGRLPCSDEIETIKIKFLEILTAEYSDI